jgi:hypothetical protein
MDFEWAQEERKNIHQVTKGGDIQDYGQNFQEHRDPRVQMSESGGYQQLYVNDCLPKVNIDEINILKGVATTCMANGDIHEKCMKGTRQLILEEIEKWRLDPDSPQILWLADVAGAGKSTVAKEMSEKWRFSGCLAGCFFFSRDAEETRTPRLFFTTIAQQGLVRLGQDVRAAVATGIRKLIDPIAATLEEQCSNIFVEPIKATKAPIILVLDALDECEPRTCKQLLRVLLPKLPSLSHLKLFMTSRPETHIQEELADVIYRNLSIRSDEVSNSKDVEYFMRQRLSKASLSHDQVEQIIDRAGGLFIWAKTVCHLLDNFRGNRNLFVDRILSGRLRQMDHIYRIALDQAIGTDKEEEKMVVHMNVLGIIVAACEPVSPNTIDKLLNSTESMAIINGLRSVLECGGEGALVRLLHPTFRQFLLNPNDGGRYFVDMNMAHKVIVGGCLSTMNKELEYNICKLHYDMQEYYKREFRFKPQELSELCLQHTSSALRYSCSFWANHIILHTDPIPSSLIFSIECFFKAKLLDWIYMVAVQGSIDSAVKALRKLASLKLVSNSNSCHFIQPG